MAQGGQEIVNPVTGERLRFLHTAEETGGDVLIFDLFLRPAGIVAGFPHRHRPAERFEVREGTLRAWIAGKGVIRARPGDIFEIPPYRMHAVVNGGTTEAWARVEVRPAETMEQLFREAFALSHPRSLGDAHPRRLAALFEDNELRFPLLPESVQSALLSSLGDGAGASRPRAPAPR